MAEYGFWQPPEHIHQLLNLANNVLPKYKAISGVSFKAPTLFPTLLLFFLSKEFVYIFPFFLVQELLSR
jgi:hypothetical protein